MKKEYTTPKIIVIGLDMYDVITASRITGGGESDGDIYDWLPNQ